MASRRKTIIITAFSAVAGVIAAILLVIVVTLIFQRGGANESDDTASAKESTANDSNQDQDEADGSFVDNIFGVFDTDTDTETDGNNEDSKTDTTIIYFVNRSQATGNEDTECSPVVPAERSVSRFLDPREQLEMLLAGPTLSEIEVGISTALPQGLIIKSLTIDDTTQAATVVLSKPLYKSFCAQKQAELQLKNTLLENDSIRRVEIR